MIKFHIPDFYKYINLNSLLIHFMRNEYKICFYDNIDIGSVYGCFPGMCWNGGRTSLGECPIETAQQIIEFLNSQGIPIRFTFTNSLVDKKLFDNEYCNIITSIAHNGLNEIIVNNEQLEEYLRTTYPNYKYILSTTAAIKGADNLNEMCKKYDYVVMEYNDNKNDDVLMNLNQKDKIEILINESCISNCPYRQEHYKAIARRQLDANEKDFLCKTLNSTNFYDAFTNPCKKNHFITTDELYNKYKNLGFENFKIQGRGLPIIYTIESYLTYMVKPEYKDALRFEFLSRLEQN